MKKFISILSVAFLATVLFNACGGNGPTTDDGVLINGVKWATRNVGSAGTFVKSPQDFGNYYTWEEAKTACPSGWRLPTYTELQGLDTGIWKTNGREFGTAPNTIFLPAAGIRDSYDGLLHLEGEYGSYWSSTQNEDDELYAYRLYFDSSYAGWDTHEKGNGYSVRCVKE